MNDIASMRKMRPLESFGPAGRASAVVGLGAGAESADLLLGGKREFYRKGYGDSQWRRGNRGPSTAAAEPPWLRTTNQKSSSEKATNSTHGSCITQPTCNPRTSRSDTARAPHVRRRR